MTRIIAGSFRGRPLVVPRSRAIRPTGSRVREALMSILGQDLPRARLLDLYAGSGALGLEALSRGAAHVTFVDHSIEAIDTIRRNVGTLGAETATRIVRSDGIRFLSRLGPGAFDLIVADPPYATHDAEQIVSLFLATPIARILVVEHASTTAVPQGDTRRYGDTALTFWRR